MCQVFVDKTLAQKGKILSLLICSIKRRSYCGNPSQYGLEINKEEYTDNSDLHYGIFNFDNFAHSLFTGMSLLSITGWSSINDIVYFN